MNIAASQLGYAELNEQIRAAGEECVLSGCIGQRFIGAGMRDKRIEIGGTPGNALGAYLNGADITVHGNAQDAVGDTMNAGTIVIHGNIGDAAGYAMRGGEIYVRGNAGYRAGIHMKAYRDKRPVMVIGGRTGSFLGEYQAGGIIIVLGDLQEEKPVIGNFCGTGMHGGEMYVRCEKIPTRLPAQVKAERLERLPEGEAAQLVREWCAKFGKDSEKYLNCTYYRLTPDSANPYKQMYTQN